jgi:hypothetical protein
MLSELFNFVGVTYWPGAFCHGRHTVYLSDQHDPYTVELIPRSALNTFVLRCWRKYCDRRVGCSVQADFGLCGETLVIWVNCQYELIDHTGQPLDGIYYAGRDNRICNRLTAAQMIDWTKA